MSAWAGVGAAVGTVLAFMVALWALHKQIDVGIRAQAARIIFEIEGDGKTGSFVIRNMSDLPVSGLYGMVLFYQGALSLGRPQHLGLDKDRLASGAEARAPLPSSGALSELSAIISFRDSSGFTWKRQWPSGELRLIKRGPRRLVKNLASYGMLALFFAGLQIVDMVKSGPSVGGVLIAVLFVILGVFSMRSAIMEALLGFRQHVPRLSSLVSDSSGRDGHTSGQK